MSTSHIQFGETEKCRTFSMSIVPVQLFHKDRPNKRVHVFAMLDECSQGSFIDAEVLNSLSVQCRGDHR